MNAQAETSTSEYQGLAEKIATIREFYVESQSHADVRTLAEELSFNEGVLDIEDFFRKLKGLTRYIPDPTGAELIKAPWIMADEITSRGFAAGDCDDLATLAYALLHSVGIEARLYVAWYGKSAENPSHIFVGVPQKNGKYFAFDLVADRYGETLSGISRVEAYD
jgi:transglutaminase-like putative cysteine protease